MKKESEVKHTASSYVFGLEVHEGLAIGEHPTWALRSRDGAVSLTVPKALCANLVAGEAVLVPLAFIKSEVISTSSIIKPN